MQINPPKKSDGDLDVVFTNDKTPMKQPTGFLGSTSGSTKAKQSHLTDHGQVFDVGRAFTSNHVDTGTIVSDKRRGRASFGENVQSAFNEWWGKTSKQIAQMQNAATPVASKPRVVPKVETRSTIVQKAITQENLPPRDDHHAVVQKFRTFEQDVARITAAPLIIKKVSTVPKPTGWTHVVETEPVQPPKPKAPILQSYPSEPIHPDLRNEIISPVVDAETRKNTLEAITNTAPKKPAISYMPEIKEVAPILPQEYAVRVAPTVDQQLTPERETTTPPVSVERPKFVTSVPPPSSNIYIPEPVKQEDMLIPKAIPVIESVPLRKAPSPVAPVFHSTTAAPKVMEQVPKPQPAPIKQTYTPAPTPHNDAFTKVLIQWTVIGLIILLGIGLALMATYYVNREETVETPISADEQIDTPVEISVRSFFDTDIQEPLEFTTSREMFLDSLTTRIQNESSDTAQFYVTQSTEGGDVPIAAQELFERLSLNLSGKTIRALDPTYMIGSVRTNKNEPFIIIRSYNFDTLFAGLLEWEPNMQADLAPLFGTPLLESRSFKDAVGDNKSIRILYDDAGQEILLYSFVNQHTVIMTTSGEALAQLIRKF